MPSYLVKTPAVFRWLFPACVWKIPNSENKIFLTFDDGPNPVITEKILSILANYDVPATFFCIGKQAQKHPKLFSQLLNSKHDIGNHSQTHKNGWKTPNKEYLNDVDMCSKVFTSSLFRPPYGKITPKQVKKLMPHFNIIMWDIIGADFDENVDSLKIQKNIIENTESGSIIVLHDNPKFADKMIEALPSIIIALKEKGYVFSSINDALHHRQ
ncbi:MAG: polysaccharide deacetylase family protein [Flavobacteriales bacterium]|nr:polysaccharide deacetylase family protein [Flavobacteriales bacterium]